MFPEFVQRSCQVAPALGKCRRNLERPLIGCDSPARLLDDAQDIAQVVMDIGIVRIQLRRLREMLDRPIISGEILVGQADIVLRLRIIRLLAYRSQKVLDGLSRPLRIDVKHAQQIQCMNVICILRKDLLIRGLRAREIARLLRSIAAFKRSHY
jgi:predicted metalloprotease